MTLAMDDWEPERRREFLRQLRQQPRKLELGAGNRPTRGYTHHDAVEFPHIEITGDPWMLDLPDGSLEEVLALAFVEHLTFDHARDTFRNVHRMLEPGGMFLFDVPDYPTWCRYYLAFLDGKAGTVPVSLDHVRRTLFGWQRWPGDEHNSGWDAELLAGALEDCGFEGIFFSVEPFLERGLYRRRFTNPDDAHLYVCAVK